MSAPHVVRVVVGGIAAALALAAISCGPEEGLLLATFTSDVIQLDTCRMKDGDDRELCTREDANLRLRVTLLEEREDRVWIQGVPLGGEDDRRILGTRDTAGGFLFVFEREQENLESGCTIHTLVELSLRVDDEADPDTVGADDCVALVGREERRVHASAECDEVNVEQKGSTRIIRRRWQRAPLCGQDP